jgi:uncharacterized protein (DUF2147 family)
MKTLLSVVASAFLMASGEPAACSPIGTWLAKDGTKIRIAPCGGSLCGVIAETVPPNDPDTNRPWTDKNNIDPTKRNRRLIGVPLLISMKPDGPRNWAGQLYNVDDGKTYSGNLIELGHASVRVEGCSLGICDGEELTRVN